MSSWTTGYSVGRAQRVCSATGKPLAVGDQTIAALVENPDTNQVERRDYSLDAWNNPKGRPVPARQLVGFWKTTVAAPDEKPRPILDDESMLDLFSQTEGAVGPRAALRLVLALLLTRRRLLVHEGNKGTTMLVRARGVPRPPDGPALLEVADPGVAESTIRDVLGELEGMGVGSEQAAPPTEERVS